MPRRNNLRRLLAAAVFGTCALAAPRAHAQTNTTAGNITVIVAFAPGGVADTLARLIAQGLNERLHQTVVVENRAGAGGNIAADLVAHAQPNGSTILATTTAFAINETLFTNKPFAASDFRTAAIAASSPEALVTGPGNPARDLAELVKNASGKTINLAIPGVGTGSDIEAEYFFKFLAKTPVQPIPFQGGAPAINATIGNQVDLMATTLGGGAAAQIAGGKLKGLGIAAGRRAAVAPNLPTYAEQGFPGFTAASWVGFFVPSKTDPQVLATLNAAINDIVKTPEVQTKLADMGFDPITGTPAEADALFTAEVKKWGDMVRALGLSIK
ncbi:MAG TPA: tripartite tricarboxylate transporter substrate-binding protein [Xanthobacteraceae bacterium]